MDSIALLDKIAITVRARKILLTLLAENPILEKIMRNTKSVDEALKATRAWMLPKLKRNPAALDFYKNKKHSPEIFKLLSWPDMAVIRILDYIDNAGVQYPDLNIGGELAVSNPVKMIWLAVNYGAGGAKPSFFKDMLQLFRQLNGTLEWNPPKKVRVERWMQRFRSGLDPKIVELRKKNKKRIIKLFIEKMDAGEISDSIYYFNQDSSYKEKETQMMKWWKESRFHLKFAIRTPELLNEMLNYSLDPDTMNILHQAKEKGIPFFINPYFLSLLNVQTPEFAVGSDLAIRCYVIYSKQLVEEFGNIVAWEKEDKVEPGKPNAAGWILPSHNIHRRYPEVAIFIPDTVGRACGGLCASCQRMYDFQSGRYNFNLEKLKPADTWNARLPKLLDYFKKDTQLRDILITGGDAFMSSDRSLELILKKIYEMALYKKEANKNRPYNNQLAEIVRVRIGTRLPVYLPQRITSELCRILRNFKLRAEEIGIRQFIIQTHIESPMEITPETKKAVKMLLSSGWVVTNQLVFTAAASRRGHTAKLRKTLNQINVLNYYTFTVKGYKENSANFAPNSRAVQEQMEEKVFGLIPDADREKTKRMLEEPKKINKNIKALLEKTELPFLSTDRNILNLPGVGKSLTFRTIGITRYGRRILEFDHDNTRSHSPIIHQMGKVIIIESKSIGEYLEQLEEMGEDPNEYEGIYGYSIGQTEFRMPMYEYPEYHYQVTREFSNLEI